MSILRNDAFLYLSEIKKESQKKATSIGLLIDSGGIIGILSYSGGNITGPLKTAFILFLASIVSLFVVEMISMITASRSLEQLFTKNELFKVDITKLCFFNFWIKGWRYFINFGSVACGCYAIQISMNFIMNN